jgi:hypothetical protein
VGFPALAVEVATTSPRVEVKWVACPTSLRSFGAVGEARVAAVVKKVVS